MNPLGSDDSNFSGLPADFLRRFRSHFSATPSEVISVCRAAILKDAYEAIRSQAAQERKSLEACVAQVTQALQELNPASDCSNKHTADLATAEFKRVSQIAQETIQEHKPQIISIDATAVQSLVASIGELSAAAAQNLPTTDDQPSAARQSAANAVSQARLELVAVLENQRVTWKPQQIASRVALCAIVGTLVSIWPFMLEGRTPNTSAFSLLSFLLIAFSGVFIRARDLKEAGRHLYGIGLAHDKPDQTKSHHLFRWQEPSRSDRLIDSLVVLLAAVAILGTAANLYSETGGIFITFSQAPQFLLLFLIARTGWLSGASPEVIVAQKRLEELESQLAKLTHEEKAEKSEKLRLAKQELADRQNLIEQAMGPVRTAASNLEAKMAAEAKRAAESNALLVKTLSALVEDTRKWFTELERLHTARRLLLSQGPVAYVTLRSTAQRQSAKERSDQARVRFMNLVATLKERLEASLAELQPEAVPAWDKWDETVERELKTLGAELTEKESVIFGDNVTAARIALEKFPHSP